jgi:hypothetical protein
LEELKGAAAMEVGEEREEELKRIRVPLILPLLYPKIVARWKPGDAGM